MKPPLIYKARCRGGPKDGKILCSKTPRVRFPLPPKNDRALVGTPPSVLAAALDIPHPDNLPRQGEYHWKLTHWSWHE